jgi:hypothetical protein
MSFLAPLFLVGAAAIAAPIIFHLIRRTVKDRVRFSTLMFLKESPPRLTKRSHLENILLLLMRCAVICLLAFSFARPYFQRAAAEPAKAASGRRYVILLDTSASMRRTGLFDVAKRNAIAAIRRADANDSLAVIAFDSAPRTLLSFEQWQAAGASERLATAINRVESATPTWQATHLGKAIVSAAELILDASRADAEGGRSTIVVVSDLQQGAKLDGIQGFEWPRGLEVSLQPVSGGPQGNAGVQILAANAGEGLSITNISLRARVANSPGAKVEQFKIGWASSNGNFLSTPLELHVPGGQNRSIGMPALPTNNANLIAFLSGDAETFDNRAYHAAPPRQTLRVTYIGSDNADDPNGELFYVRRAFPETSVLSVKVDAREPGSGKPIEGSLAIVTALNNQDIPALKKHLEGGAAALVVLPANADASALAGLTEGNTAPAVSEATGSYVLLATVDFDHPIFTQFRDARFNDFTRIHFWKHRKVDLTALPKARAVASFDDNTPALVQLPVGKGALYILTSGWRPTDSQFALSSKFVPFLYSLLELSAPITTQARQLTVGDAVPFPGDFTGESIALTKPDGTSVQWKKSEAFAGTDQPGFYSATNPKLLFAVNLDPLESRTAPIGEDQLASLGLPLKHEEAPVSVAEKKQRDQLLLATEQESRQKLWRKLLFAAIAILVIEAAVARVASTRARPAEAV